MYVNTIHLIVVSLLMIIALDTLSQEVIYTDPNKYRHYIDVEKPSPCTKYNIEHKGLRYTKMQNFSEGLILIKIDNTGDWAYMDSRSYVIMPPQNYSDFGWFAAGLAAVRNTDTNKWGYINPEMELVIPFIYDAAWPFSKFEEIAQVRKNGTEYYINRQGKRVNATNATAD